MNWLKQFADKYSISAHTLAVLMSIAVAAYNEVPQFHALVLQLWAHVPAHVQTTLVSLAVTALWYKQNRKEWTLDERKENLK